MFNFWLMNVIEQKYHVGPRAISLELGGKSPLIVFEDADLG
jgi:acyl-CoA reductase-like NAD-dependent aldehyde dehydrogenase